MQHLGAESVGHGEADVRAVLGRVEVDAERALAEGRRDDVDDHVGDDARLGVVRYDLAERLQNLLAEILVRPGLVFGGAGGVCGAARMGEMVGPLGEGAGHHDRRFDAHRDNSRA